MQSVGFALSLTLALAAFFILFRMAWKVCLGGSGRVRPHTFGGFEMGLAAGLIALFSMLMAGGSGQDQTKTAEIGIEGLVVGGVFQIGLCLAVLATLLFRRHPLLQIGGYDSMKFGRQMAWSVFFLAVSLPFIDLISRLSVFFHGGAPQPQAVVNFARNVDTAEGQIAIIVFAVIIAPITEEFLFRGFLYPALKATLGAALSILLTSLLFGMIHLNSQAMAPLAALGFVMALSYERTGSLIVPMTVHSLFNALSLVAMRFPDAQS